MSKIISFSNAGIATTSVKVAGINGIQNIEVDMSINDFADAYDRWMDGEYLQDAFPNLSADIREFFLTGVDADAFDDLFGEDE